MACPGQLSVELKNVGFFISQLDVYPLAPHTCVKNTDGTRNESTANLSSIIIFISRNDEHLLLVVTDSATENNIKHIYFSQIRSVGVLENSSGRSHSRATQKG